MYNEYCLIITIFVNGLQNERSYFFLQIPPFFSAKYDGPGKGLASRACNWYINSRYGFRVSMSFEFFSVEGDPPCKHLNNEDNLTE